MAPELVTERLSSIQEKQILLDPMMGSGTFVIAAARAGHEVVGVDSDPLTHILVEAAYGAYSESDYMLAASHVIEKAKLTKEKDDNLVFDAETSAYIDFWFDADTRLKLSAIAAAIREAPECLRAPLWCAFSRMIITKDAGASRARDVSHSRPHRVREVASFDVLSMYPQAASIVLKRAKRDIPAVTLGSLTLLRGDSRKIPLADQSIDGVMTSPPYLVAIDYLRGHRMSLVWMGYSIKDLRALRSDNVGSARGEELCGSLRPIIDGALQGSLDPKLYRVVCRYINDVDILLSEITRVLRFKGEATFVVANPRHSSALVSVEEIFIALARPKGLELRARRSRLLPDNRRYLPPPKASGLASPALEKRMSSEVILDFVRR